MSSLEDNFRSFRVEEALPDLTANSAVIPSGVEESRENAFRYGHGILRLRFASLRMTLFSSGQLSKRRGPCGARAALIMSIFFVAFSPLATSQDISLTTATPTPSAAAAEENPFAQFVPHREPIPLRWKIAVVLAVIIISSAALWISMRVWRSSNLFDRQYRFPEVATAALRLGANRSGGHMAVVTFHERARPNE